MKSADREFGDFGNLVRGSALGTAEPTNLTELASLVNEARRTGTKLTLRGSGASQSGQSVPRNSVLVSTARMNAVDEVDVGTHSVCCEAGATYREVLRQCLPHGLAPKVMPVYLDLTVGGVLSAGGLGTTTHRSGPAIAQVEWADVVLGSGEVVRTSATEARPVYDAVLGGVGRCGAIARAQLRLEPVPQRLRTFFLVYERLGDLMHDAISLGDRVAYLEAFASSSVHGLARGTDGSRRPLMHWSYGLHLTFDASQPGYAGLPSGLRHRAMLHEQDDDFEAFCRLYDPRIAEMKTSGAWGENHPWFEVILPATTAAQFIERALELLPPTLGSLHRISFIADVDVPNAMALPPHPRVVFAVLPFGIKTEQLPHALAALRQVDTLARDVGGKRYLSGYLHDTSEDAWRHHYGSFYDVIVRAKLHYDASDVFTSMLSQP